ncbi:MAG: hypothetical protein Cons2KO_16170 [Congregibacter sp.]
MNSGSQKYSILQQKLIDSRDRLDREVGRLTRINEFNIRVLRMDADDSFAAVVSEALVDVFELEFGICWRLDSSAQTVGVPSVLGLEPPQGSLRHVARLLRQALKSGPSARRLTARELDELQKYLPVADGLAALCCAKDGTPLMLLFAGNTHPGTRIFEQITEEMSSAFLVFTAQAAALEESFLDRQTIARLNKDMMSILHAIPDTLFEIDAYGRYVNVWPSREAVLRAPRDQLIGANLEDHLPPDAAATLRASIAEADAKGSSVGKQLRLQTPQGDRWLEMSVAVKDASSVPRTYMVLSRNVSERREADRRLRESESRFRRIFEQTDVIAVQGYDRERRVFYWNAASERLYGYTAAEAIGRPLDELIAPMELVDVCRESLEKHIRDRVSVASTEMVLRHADGSPLSVLCSHVSTATQNHDGDMYCIGIDLSDLRRAEDRVRQLSQAVEQSPVAVVITDVNGAIEYVNRACCEGSGYDEDELIGVHASIFQSPKLETSYYTRLLDSLGPHDDWHGELQNQRKDGQIYWVQSVISPVVDDNGQVIKYLAVNEDISLRKAQEEEIVRQATYDSLTKLPNRLLVLDRLENLVEVAQRDASPVAVIFLDVDDFKKVNDSLGHDVGDEVLIEAGQRISRAVRAGDTVGRLGGDEFIVLLRNLGESVNASRVADAIIAEFRRPFTVGSREMLLTVSGGIALFPEDGDRPSDLLRKADSAMYHAKSLGKNTYAFFTDTLNQGIERRLLVEEQLHGALSRGELAIVYQPKVNLATGNVDGIEALLRWNNPVLGQVSPSEFIPIAEQSGHILPIGRYVLSSAVAQVAVWKSSLNRPITVAVNLSPRQFRDSSLLAFLQVLIEKHALDPGSLELEITEGILIDGNQGVDLALDQFKERGIRLVMDDFGTGYSSLSYLRTYPFDVLKIDRSFVRDMTIDSADLELVSAAIAMGHGLGLSVVAEGVENQEQLDLLVNARCDSAQGFFFSRPLSPDKITQLLTRRFEMPAYTEARS